MMKLRMAALAALALGAATMVHAQEEGGEGGGGRRPPIGPVQGQGFRTQYIRLGQQGEGLLYEPTAPGAKARIAVVFTHPGGNNFMAPIGRELAARGYRVMNINYRGGEALGVDDQLPTISQAVAYLRALPGVQKVVVAGHSGGAHEMALYENVAENGAKVCSGPELVIPCHVKGIEALQKPDGLILLDPPLGAFHEASSLDPAVDKDTHARNPALDMFSAANGYDGATRSAHYSAAFAKTFYAAQAARNAKVLDEAQARLKAIDDGKGQYSNDEPFTVPGLGVDAGGARLFQADTGMLAHTKAPHMLLKADGTRPVQVVQTVRPPAACRRP
jgi:hypothetical protein